MDKSTSPNIYVTMYKCFFFGTSAFFFLPAAGLFSWSRIRGTKGARPDATAQVWVLAEARRTCSGGSNWQIPTRSDSEQVEPSRPMHTQVYVKRMSDGSCDIWDLECRQRRQTLLGDGKIKIMSDGSCTG